MELHDVELMREVQDLRAQIEDLRRALDAERFARMRAETNQFSEQWRFDTGLIDIFDALIQGLIARELVPADFLIRDLANWAAVWGEPTPERPEGRNLARAEPIRHLLTQLHLSQASRANFDETVRPN
jgi:hypothetical protein